MANVVVVLVLSSAFSALVVAAPCDIYDAAGTPCVAAHSTVRALYSAYSGPLYQVQRDDKKNRDIGLLNPGGIADAAAQDSFCSGSACVISRIYDQSKQLNHLDVAPTGGNIHTPLYPVNASRHRLLVGGHAVYGAYFEGDMGYRNDKTKGIATGDEPESMYMVTSGKHYNAHCCFDYGNAETDNNDDGAGTMEAIYWGNMTGSCRGSGVGPWVMADLENGLFACAGDVDPNNTPIIADYVTAMVKGREGGFALKGGDAQKGELKSLYDGGRPNNKYDPMRKQGAIILGIGGDDSDQAVGTFYEGVMTTGFSSNATDDAVQADIVAVGYGH